MIYAICGKSGSGKDTVGNIIKKHSKEVIEHICFGDEVKIACHKIWNEMRDVKYGVSLSEFYTQDGKNKIRGNGSSLRNFMISFAMWVRNNVDQDFWVKSAIKKMKSQDKSADFVITDLRFENERKLLEQNFPNEVMFIKVFRDDDKNENSKLGIHNHISETYSDRIKDCFVLDNNGSLEDLEKNVIYLLKLISDMNKLKLHQK